MNVGKSKDNNGTIGEHVLKKQCDMIIVILITNNHSKTKTINMQW